VNNPDAGEIINVPEKLLKKKCHCGKQLKFFSIIGVPFLPEGFSLAVYLKELELDKLVATPGFLSTNLIFSMAFAATCEECGNITAWRLSIEEIAYLVSDDRSDGYGIAWVYNQDTMKEQFEDFPLEYVKDNMQRIAVLAENKKLNAIFGLKK